MQKSLQKEQALKYMRLRKCSVIRSIRICAQMLTVLWRQRMGKKEFWSAKRQTWQNRDAWADEKYPYQYELQIRHYMAVTNLDFAYIACLWGNNENDFAYRYVERDIEFEDEIIEMEQSFWEENVLKEIEPPFVEKPDMALKCLKMYLEGADTKLPRMSIPAALQGNIEQYLALREEKSKAEAEVKKLEKEMKRLSIPVIEEMGACCESELAAAGKKYYISYRPRKAVRIKKEDLEKLADTSQGNLRRVCVGK